MHTILTMSRGDEHRLEDWVYYHASLGFDRFHILLDNPNDESEAVLDSLSGNAGLDIQVEVLPARGDYYDSISSLAERTALVTTWKKRNASKILDSGLPIVDPLSERQYHYFPERLQTIYESDPGGWVSIIDVDEYIVLPEGSAIQDLTRDASHPRFRFRNFNFDMTGWDHKSSVRRFNKRWSRAAIEAYGNGWQNRVKSLVLNEKSRPLVSVHAISKGSFLVLPDESYRLHHYKYPLQGIPVPYDVSDTQLAGIDEI